MSRQATRIRIKDIPDFGMPVEGFLLPKALDLDEKDIIQATGNLNFDLNVTTDEDKEVVMLQGTLTGDFELQCVGCLDRFAHRLDVSDYFSDIELEDKAIDVDIAEVLREDALMALPNYPRCDLHGTDPDRVCENTGTEFHYESKPNPEAEKAAAEEKPDVWAALDDFKSDK